MKTQKKILALFLAVLMLVTAVPLTVINAGAAQVYNQTISKSDYGLIKGGGSSRFNGSNFNIVNDCQADNTSAGIIRFDLPDLTGYDEITSVTLNAVVDSYNTEIRPTGYYYSTSSTCAGYLGGAEHQISLTAGGWYTGRNSLLKACGITGNFNDGEGGIDGPNKIGSIPGNDTQQHSFDMTQIVKNAVASGTKTIYIIIVKDEAGGTGNEGGWSDTTVDPNKQTLTIKADSLNFNDEVFGNVSLGPIVYVHGEYTGVVHNSITDKHQYDYMTYGSQVADCSYQGELYTTVSSSKTISSIVVEDTGATLTTKNITSSWYDGRSYTVLTGDLGGGYGTVRDNSNSTVTLKFIFNDGTFEYHKRPVKINPVAEHTLSTLFAWCQPAFAYRYPVPFEVLAYGSYGTLGRKGSYTLSDYNNHLGTTNEVNENYGSMYSYNSGMDSWEDDSTVKMDTMTNEVASFDKKAGYFVGYTYKNRSAKTMSVSSPVARYYLDLSSNDNFGVNYSTTNPNNYSIRLYVSSIYFSGNPDDTNAAYAGSSHSASGSSTINSVSMDSGINSGINVKGQTSGYVTLTGTPRTGTTSATYTIGYKNKNNDPCEGTLNITTIINLYVSDRTAQRNGYNELVNQLKSLKVSCFTQDSWNNMRTALLNLEEWLNDNTDTTTNGANLLTAAQNAKTALVHSEESNHNLVLKNSTPATCLEQSTENYECSYNCGYTKTTHDTQALGHSWDNGVVTKEATCVDKGVKTYTCQNDKDHTRTEDIPATGIHTPDEPVEENRIEATCTKEGSYELVTKCKVCGEDISRTTVTIPKKEHTWGQPTTENFVDSSCSATGSYDEVVRCTVCGELHSSEPKTVEKKDHTRGEPTTEDFVDSSCTATGSYNKVVRCTVCGQVIESEKITIEKKEHTPDEPVIENRIEATCTTPGSYELVTKCKVCGEVIKKEKKTIDMIDHTPGEEQEENRKEATCTELGSYDLVVRCTACGTVISKKEVTIPKKAHTPGDPVEEDKVDSTCTTEGSYN